MESLPQRVVLECGSSRRVTRRNYAGTENGLSSPSCPAHIRADTQYFPFLGEERLHFRGAVLAPSHLCSCKRWVCSGDSIVPPRCPIPCCPHTAATLLPPAPAPHPFPGHGESLALVDGATDGAFPPSIPFPRAFCYEFPSLLWIHPPKQPLSSRDPGFFS